MAEEIAQSPQQPNPFQRRLAQLIGGYQVSAAIGALARLGVPDARGGVVSLAGISGTATKICASRLIAFYPPKKYRVPFAVAP